MELLKAETKQNGVRGKGEKQCIVSWKIVMDGMRLAFEYLFKSLQVTSEDAKEFIRCLQRVLNKGQQLKEQ